MDLAALDNPGTVLTTQPVVAAWPDVADAIAAHPCGKAKRSRIVPWTDPPDAIIITGVPPATGEFARRMYKEGRQPGTGPS